MFVLTAVAVAAALLAPTAADYDYTQDPEPRTYYLLPGGEDGPPDPVAACLFRLGWSGRGGDGLAAIYAPTAVIRNCGGEVGGDTWV